MSKKEIEEYIHQQIIEKEINNWHDISKDSISKYLVEPIKSKYINASDGKINEYLLVLDEMVSDPKNGYQIIYDERENEFGLATKTSIQTDEIGVIIGLHGSFIDALNAM